MNIEDRPTKEFIDYILNVGNDPKYQNETLPGIKIPGELKNIFKY